MKSTPVAAAVLLLALIPVLGKEPDPITLNLATGAVVASSEDAASITAYLPEKAKATGAGVVVVPGGSFLIRCEDHEGTQVAKWFTRHGIAAFVVHYRLIPRFTICDELEDTRRALQFVRRRAAEFSISTNRLGVIGFSAGAFLAGEAALKSIENGRPDFLVLVYGAPGGTNDPINGFNRYFADQAGLDAYKECTATTLDQVAKAPPTFMFCTAEDRGAARKMGEFHLQLLKQGVSSEAHFFADGPHGVGFAQHDPILGEWPDLMHHWLRAKNVLAASPPVGITGSVTIDGKPMDLGYIVFKPADKSQNPIRTAYIFNRSGPKGAFEFKDAQGLVPGKYHVEIYQMAKKWNSVWAEPLLQKIQSKLNSSQKLSDEEIAAWKAWAEARQYQPTQSDLVKLDTKIIEVERGKPILIEARSK